MKRNNFNLLLLTLLIVLFISCDTAFLDPVINGEDDAIKVDWSGEVKLPAGNLTYTVSELFDELGASDFGTNSTEELKLSHSQSFSSAGQDNSAFDVDVPNTTISSTINTPITAVDISPGTFPFTITGSVPPELQGKSQSNQVVHDLQLTQELTEASLNSGTMTITFNSTFDANVTLSLNIPSFTKKSNNATYSESVTLNGAGTTSFNVNLNEYNADFTHNGTDFNNTTNRVVLNLNAAFDFYVGGVINSTDKITYDAVLAGAGTEVVYGDFKQEAFSVSNQPINLDFFDNFGDGDVDFSNAKMTITATNDFGFPIGIDLSNIVAVGSGSNVALTYDGNGTQANNFIIDGVTNFGDSEKITSVTLNSTNSNIVNLLKAKPTSINLNVAGTANPESATGNSNFYATSNNGLNVELTISFDDVSLNKSIEFDNGGDLEDVNSMGLSVSVENKIPLSGNVVLVFKNNSNQTLHTETLQAFKAANVNASGESDGIAVDSNFSINLDKTEINNISNATKVDVTLTLDLPDGEDTVQIKGTDEVTIYIGASVDANFSTEDN